ncbi:profilin [Salpingoeca rosetta]|uniref:Profilin n=1 Tax=Salpingoeca rosetta (strain ATCC 50818 / BSB-021) TaxID=946362 RepID=F2UPM4_SALR5|nr:profilin [Salpingoeca rosetta]EGD79579.1 profilin [Salpingoeca rosetta]|eukprot:XP_004988807.1 profilin [Salpingoeca rosetta]
MSWQQYVDQHLIATGKVSKAAIHGLDGNPWATSAGFTVAPAEAAALARAFGDPQPLYQTGIVLNGVKYMFLRATDRSLLGRKGGDAGCIVVKTNQALLIGVYEGGLQGGDCNNVVEKLADYLASVGY